jgi:hypothetical protein
LQYFTHLTYFSTNVTQGPPGTGKTHTVLGILNTWHLTQFQRYYTRLEAWLVAQARAARGGCFWVFISANERT